MLWSHSDRFINYKVVLKKSRIMQRKERKCIFKCLFIDFERERWGKGWKKGGRDQFVIPLIYAFIGWFLYVPWQRTELTTLAYWDVTLTNWATQSRRKCIFRNIKEQLRGIESRLAGTNIQLIGIPEEKNRRNDREVMFKEIIPKVSQY